ncbi:MAG: Peptidyl-prolyl cis-trans isomerase cyp8 [Geoglossum simile]|nr:MAG: Peptidyl-prolyl cis-trans isomerase cyp8 [Geoglossum simile]
MGKGTDKLYITHSEWSSSDAYSASSGSGATKPKATGANFKRLPFNFCAVSLQPFAHPVCTADGAIFDLTNILPWLKKHGTNPVTGKKLESKELIKLNFHKNDDGEYVDPVTYKVFTDNTHIVALRNTGNVFAWDTVERLNIKAKMWKDLVSDETFGRSDIITLQDPQNVGSRDLSSFKFLQDGVSNLTPQQEAERADPLSGINLRATGSSAKVLAAKQAVAKAREARTSDPNYNPALQSKKSLTSSEKPTNSPASAHKQNSTVPYNAAGHTTGKAAASFTSTGLTPHTSLERALLTDEEYMLKPRRVKIKGYARIQTSLGDLNVELQTEYAPKAVYNFVQLAKKGYYRDTTFHRNIRNFMIQGGDPTGTGKGGTSHWGKNFNDDFITYRPAKHLDRKHTIFGRVVGGLDALDRLENAKTDSSDRPLDTIHIDDVVVFVDPFEEFQKQRREKEEGEREREEIRRMGGREDERTTWTGKRVWSDGGGGGESKGETVGGGVGKYLKMGNGGIERRKEEDKVLGEEWEGMADEPVKKKPRGGGGFGNFDSW